MQGLPWGQGREGGAAAMPWAALAQEELPKRCLASLVLAVTLAEQAQCSSQPCPSPLCLFACSHPTALVRLSSSGWLWWSSPSSLWGGVTLLTWFPAPAPLSDLQGELAQTSSATGRGLPAASACSLPARS